MSSYLCLHIPSAGPIPSKAPLGIARPQAGIEHELIGFRFDAEGYVRLPLVDLSPPASDMDAAFRHFCRSNGDRSRLGLVALARKGG